MLRYMCMDNMNAPQSGMPNGGIGLALSYSFSQ